MSFLKRIGEAFRVPLGVDDSLVVTIDIDEDLYNSRPIPPMDLSSLPTEVSADDVVSARRCYDIFYAERRRRDEELGL